MSRSLCLRPSVSTESFPNTDFTLPLPLTKEASHLETCLAKPECDPSESFKQTFHQFQREQHSLESHAFWVPAAWPSTSSSVPATVVPGRQHPTHGAEPGSCTLWATQGTTHLGRLGWGSEISTWTSDLGEHMTIREF